MYLASLPTFLNSHCSLHASGMDGWMDEWGPPSACLREQYAFRKPSRSQLSL